MKSIPHISRELEQFQSKSAPHHWQQDREGLCYKRPINFPGGGRVGQACLISSHLESNLKTSQHRRTACQMACLPCRGFSNEARTHRQVRTASHPQHNLLHHHHHLLLSTITTLACLRSSGQKYNIQIGIHKHTSCMP